MISDKQEHILEFIRGFIVEHEYPPTVRDVAGGCGLSSTSVAEYHLDVLHREGYIKRIPKISRGICLTGNGGIDGLPQSKRIPIP